MKGVELDGLVTGPAQTSGVLRLVPLVRAGPVPGLRLHRHVTSSDLVDVGDGTHYTGYIPHAFVAKWGDDEDESAAYGTSLTGPESLEEIEKPPRIGLRATRRLHRRPDRHRLRFLPLHVAMEGYLALHFGGPSIMWEEWARHTARGIGPRWERSVPGWAVAGLEDALRVFEIHPGQCGVLVYAADALAAAFVVPHPDDYRALHGTLVEDMFGELIERYALLGVRVADVHDPISETAVRTLADLRVLAERRHDRWARFHDATMAGAILGDAPLTWQHVARSGRFTLRRFHPSFDRHTENHIGEAITDHRGRLAYLKTFRLSPAQIRRGRLLDGLASHDWNLSALAAALGEPEHRLAARLEQAGFAHLLRRDVADRYRAQNRR